MQKIIFIVNTLGIGGAETYVVNAANELVDKFDVYILFDQRNMYVNQLNKNIKLLPLNLNLGSHRGNIFLYSFSLWKCFFYLNKIFKNQKDLFFITTLVESGIVAWLYSKFFRVRCFHVPMHLWDTCSSLEKLIYRLGIPSILGVNFVALSNFFKSATKLTPRILGIPNLYMSFSRLEQVSHRCMGT